VRLDVERYADLMAQSNWTHLFIDGRRVSFDRRDNSVTLYPEEEFRVARATRVGYAERSASGWTATAPDGTTHHAAGRKAAAEWLIKATAGIRAQAEAERERQEQKDEDAIAEALAILDMLGPDVSIAPFRMSEDTSAMFLLSPVQMRDLLVAVTDDTKPRRLPLATAMQRVCERHVVLFSMTDPYSARPFEWGYLSAFAFEDATPDRPDLGAYVEFFFERGPGEETSIGISCLGSTALVTRDAITVEDESGLLVVVIAEEAPEMLDVPASNALEWDREAIVQIAQNPPPVMPEEDEDEEPKPS
jgi:hypothetical protein